MLLAHRTLYAIVKRTKHAAAVVMLLQLADGREFEYCWPHSAIALQQLFT
jgi:hypothetical protein